MQPLTSHAIRSLKGTITVPGDKSISHRSLLLASQAVGTSHITGLLEGEDVLHTADALRKMGVKIEKNNQEWVVHGVGTGSLSEPTDVLDMGNSGTGARLLMGLVASHPFSTTFTGDESLRKRPMGRVIKPLTEMGASFTGREGNLLPLTITGYEEMIPIRYTLPVPSAQVKSAILLAALNIPGETTVIELESTRDHTERMLRALGATILTKPEGRGRHITITGQPELLARDIGVPADPSSAAFPVVAALLAPEAEVTLTNICINSDRIGLYLTLQEMGADLHFINNREVNGEPVADIQVKASRLKAIRVPAERAPSMIDEYPILAVAAAFAEGTTIMEGLQELRVKESDRLAAIADGLKACGVTCVIKNDTLSVQGRQEVQGGCTIKTHMDHRLAMSFLVMGTRSKEPVQVDDGTMINTSFPGFVTLMNGLGARIT